jgi:hypothetical protein
MRRGSSEKQTHQLLTLGCIEFPWTAQRKTHFEGLRPTPATSLPLAHHRNRRTTNTASYFVQRVTVI